VYETNRSARVQGLQTARRWPDCDWQRAGFVSAGACVMAKVGGSGPKRSRVVIARRSTVTRSHREEAGRAAAYEEAVRLNGSGRGTYEVTDLQVLWPTNLAEPDPPLRPLIRGIAERGTFGPLGGKHKTLKSHTMNAFAVAVAAGVPAFGLTKWAVPEALPIVILDGESGKKGIKRRLRRIAREMYGIEDIGSLPVVVLSGIAEMNAAGLRNQLGEVVSQIERRFNARPGLVALDALYNFHPKDIEVGNVYARGPMLSDFQHMIQEVVGPDCVLWVVDHFRKDSRTLDLDEYQQSGMSQWADSWVNLEHQKDPDLNGNHFWLNIQVGSRSGYGGLYEIEWDLGPFDDEAMEPEREMTWEVRQVPVHKRETRRSGRNEGVPDEEIERRIFELVDSGDYNKTKLREAIGGRSTKVGETINRLVTQRLLFVERAEGRDAAGKRMPIEVLRRAGKLSSGSRRRDVGS